MKNRMTMRWVNTLFGCLVLLLNLSLPARGVETPPTSFVVRLIGRSIDTAAAVEQSRRLGTPISKLAVEMPVNDQKYSTRGTLPYLVQFVGPIREEWKIQLHKTGATIKGYVPENAFLVEIDPRQLGSIARIESVQWIGDYRAEDKVERGLAARIKVRQAVAATVVTGKKSAQVKASDANECVVTISTFSPADVDRIWQAVEGVGGVVLKTAQGTRRGLMRARLPLDDVSKLSALAEVEWIERYVEPVLNNNVAVDAPRMNVKTVWTNFGLTGAGQVVGIADTGLDTGNMSTMHPDFTNRIRAAFALGRSGDWSDSAWTIFNDPAGGHGTHVAGSVLGNGSAYSNGLFKGVAYGAELVMQSVMDSDGGLGGLPADLNSLFLQAYTNGARIHSDSWGSAVNGAYNTECVSADEFMWDHPDLLTVFSAGNSGVDADGDGVVDLGNGDAPGSAKNVLTVGAAECDRSSGSGGYSAKTYANKWPADYPVSPISNDLISTSADGAHQGMAAFSSRGPCDDGRFKPDIVAPGTDIISCRARVSGATTLWGTGTGVLANDASNYYSFCGGTSMSTPLTAGSAALVRQYFVERRGIANPSAALIKATLMTGARSLSPGQYGDGATQEIQGAPRPNNAEGWGQVDLGDSLYPGTGFTNIFYDGNSLTTGGTNSYSFTASGGQKLSILLAWTDYPGTPAAATKLVNDLDLLVILPDGTTNNAFGKATADRINNVEGIDLDPAPAGTVTIKVIGYNVPNGPQPYALVLMTAPKSPLAKTTSPSPAQAASNVVPSPYLALSWGNGGGATSYKVYFGTNASPGGSEYRGTQSATYYVPGALDEGTYYWRVDACDASATITGTVWSFHVNMNVAASDGTYTNKVLVSWRPSPGATGYQVWRHTTNSMGAASLMGLASSTNYTDSNTVGNASYWYWIRATNAAYSSGFGGSDVGWCRGATSNVTYYVSLAGSDHNRGDSWVQAKQSVQAAVNTAISGDLVLVTNGTHQLTAEINVRTGLTVRSVNGASVTTLRGGGNRGGFRCAYVAGGATLDGFTLTNGYVNSSEAAPPGVWPPYYYGIGPCGGGAWVDGGLLQNCTVVGNSVVGLAFETWMANGGGVEVTHGGVVQSSTIQRNTVITDDLFGTDAQGGGVSISDGTVMSCTVSGNRVYGPSSYGGGIYCFGTVRNCLVTGNRAEAYDWSDGGGVDLQGGEIENCTVVGNTGDLGGGLRIEGGIARNVVAYYNSGSDVLVPYNSTNLFAYGCYGIPSYNPVIGDGIITNAPLFVNNGSGYGTNFVAGDYHLQSVSPCINTGTNQLWMMGAVDFDGKVRIADGIVEMGAYEYGSAAPALPPTPTNVAVTDGVYADKVRVTWTMVTEASGYEVWRHTSNDTNAASRIGITDMIPFDDTNVLAGITYWYWVKATNMVGISGFGTVDSGYRSAPLPPANLAASDGTYADRVQLSWLPAVGANGYQIWRYTGNTSNSASQIGATTSTVFSDTTAVSNIMYWYWVKATNGAVGGLSTPDTGWRRGGASNITYYISLAGDDLNRGDSWEQAKRTIQEGVNAAVSGDLILVTNGTYQLTTQVVVTAGVTLRSVNGAAATIIRGGGTNGGFRCAYVNSGAMLDGFTVTNGYASGFEQQGYGCGVYISSGGTVQCCVVQGNIGGLGYKSSSGGGVYVSGTLQNCVVQGNSASYCGGIYVWGGTVRNCMVLGNWSSSYSGGGVYMGSGKMENCMIVGNKGNPGVYFASYAIVRNCISFGNAGNDVEGSYAQYFTFGCFGTASAAVGDGCTTNDPVFVSNGSGYGTNFVAGDYHLQSGSPCINTGTNQAWMVGASDLDGNQRISPSGGVVDMGAYEYQNGIHPEVQYDASFGVVSNRFGFNINWTSGQVVVVDASTNLTQTNWIPLVTGTLSGIPYYFFDSKWTNYIGRFYRIRSVP